LQSVKQQCDVKQKKNYLNKIYSDNVFNGEQNRFKLETISLGQYKN